MYKRPKMLMARARNLKPSFFTNDTLGELPPLARLLFQGLWCHADRAGRLEDRPRKLKAEILPYDDCDVEELLSALHAADFIFRYTIGECSYIQIVKFSKHQNPHQREPASTIPAPVLPGADPVQCADEHDPGRAPSLNPLTPSPIRGQATDAVTTEFDALWSRYPKRAGGNSRKEALAAYRASRKRHTPEVIAAGLERYRAFIEATGKVGTEYVKQAASFFGPKDHFLEPWDVPAAKRQADPFAGMVNK